MKTISEYDLEKMFHETLSETYGSVKIAGYQYDTADVLKEIDPTAYREAFNDWLDCELGETIWEKDGEYFDSNPENEDEDE